MLFSIDVVFEQDYPRTDRAIDVAQAFGIALNTRIFRVLDAVKVDVEPGDVVYITGESGSGKSILLRTLAERISKHKIFGKVCIADNIKIDEDEILVESIGSSTDDALRLLSSVGLNDAYLFLRRYRELSDGQRYRYRVAKVLARESRYGVLVFDEFCSTLDRDTAKVVAYMLQKIARAKKKTLLIATAHDDLADDLKPDVLIRKGYGSRISIEYGRGKSIGRFTVKNYDGNSSSNSNSSVTITASSNVKDGSYGSDHECSLLKHVRIEKGCIDDWHMLEEYHYRGSRPYGIKHVFNATLKGEVVGIILYSMPAPSCRGRNIALGRVPSIGEVNRDFITISRVVVLPRFRSIGIAKMLVRHTMPLVGKRYVESIAVMGRYNPFFVKAGMREIVYEPDRKYVRVLKELESYGFNCRLAASRDYCYSILQGMDDDTVEEVLNVVSKVRFAVSNAIGRSREYSTTALHDRHILAKAVANIAMLAQEKHYYIWENPELSVKVSKSHLTGC
ncbi:MULTISPECIES: ATP-binding cassette domain-containing protein [Candidatus Nitrosocaldus]|jgi:ABC-type lipoprotein export system ATPase subunit/GNAT superfamily N-acetyltransferase|uniref:Putative Sigma 54 interacting domain protein n=1 Tax=Candidatus Nitrosocaldus cavascurensis TaxID=2058097 RepID=A0A2K5AQA5_9ARCH|nr:MULTISPECIES: ATP-binding cassette domain-containing protein [Candidatus Nitrosocaldus]SPC33805.1 putative Sigma 54 interacting domain protein [Candidatus Nitrosocaldus cavascurensis]